MKQLSKNNNQFGSLDPEKVYFVEKFGYLVKKINGGYGDPVQKALFVRINNTINDFKTDLPNIVHNLEITRLKIISSQKKVYISDQISKKDDFKSKSTISARAAEATRIISKKISVAEKESIHNKTSVSEIKTADRDYKRPLSITQTPNSSKPFLKSSIIKNKKAIADLLVVQQSSNLKNKTSSILRPSVAAIREEQRLKQIKTMQQKKESSNRRSMVSKQSITKPSIMMLTEWERRWHKYDSDIVDFEFNGYINK
ncbi:MAG: hypothetical protein GWP19_05990 [Planctomycetia bacterium]|nr:hypothetical protein [Planctomycetia bacterium]